MKIKLSKAEKRKRKLAQHAKPGARCQASADGSQQAAVAFDNLERKAGPVCVVCGKLPQINHSGGRCEGCWATAAQGWDWVGWRDNHNTPKSKNHV